MSKIQKRMINEGWAFSEQKMLHKLSRLAAQGWMLESMTTLSFQLKKQEPEEVQFAMDCPAQVKDREEYLDLFEQSGWTLVCEHAGFYLFKAPKNARPIHTDKTLLAERRRLGKRQAWLLLAIGVAGLMLSVCCMKLYALGMLLGMLFGALFGMSAVLLYGYYFREGR